MEKKNNLIKIDKNFINYPFNLLENTSKCAFWSMENEWGRYEMSCREGLPDHHDMLVFYSALSMLWKQRKGINKVDWDESKEKYELNTTRYAVAKLIYKDVAGLSSEQYQSIVKSLAKWVTFNVDFKGVFYKTKSHGWASFGLINTVVFEHESNHLYIDFNKSYVDQIEESDFYSFVDLDELKEITAASAGRLYQLLSINFDNRSKWQIELQKLAEKLTLRKRPKAKKYYASEVLKKIKSGIDEINKKTTLRFNYSYNTETCVFTFRKVAMAIPALRATKIMPNTMKDLLVKYKVHGYIDIETIQESYSLEYVQSKIALLHRQTIEIKNPGAWLKKAIFEDWVEQGREIISLDKLRRRQLKENEEYRLKHEEEQLQKRYHSYLDSLAIKKLNKLDSVYQAKIDEEFNLYFEEQRKINEFARRDILLQPFINNKMLTEEDKNYPAWLEKINKAKEVRQRQVRK